MQGCSSGCLEKGMVAVLAIQFEPFAFQEVQCQSVNDAVLVQYMILLVVALAGHGAAPSEGTQAGIPCFDGSFLA